MSRGFVSSIKAMMPPATEVPDMFALKMSLASSGTSPDAPPPGIVVVMPRPDTAWDPDQNSFEDPPNTEANTAVPIPESES